MKFSTIPALVLAAAASLAAVTAAAEPQKTTGQQADKAPAAKMQPHSHLEEKTGMRPQKKTDKATSDKQQEANSASKAEGEAATEKPKTAATQSGKFRADKDKAKHFHPRDGK